MATNPEPEAHLEITLNTEWSTLIRLARATLAVDQLGEFQNFPDLHLADALDTLKSEFVQAHAAVLEALELT